MKFEEAYIRYIEKHSKGRRGERLRRLKEGKGHTIKLFLEYVWWPAFGNFEDNFFNSKVPEQRGY
jgi:hypothetical protein